MSAVLRQLALLAVAAALSWWLLLAPRAPEPVPERRERADLAVALVPVDPPLAAPLPEPAAAAPVEPLAEASEPEPTPAAPRRELDLPEAPPPPELGAPEGTGEVAATAPEPGEEAPEPPLAEALMEDGELLAAAEAELSGDARAGFATVLLASPAEQLDIARFFGEELVLVPKSGLDPSGREARYFRLVGERVERVDARPPLERYRQYRDLFAYEYSSLPPPLRELRKSVLARNEVYLFAALIPAREWAVLVGRRRAALETAGRPLDDVRRCVLRYVRRAGGGFDLAVEEIVFADGARWRPAAVPRGS